MAVPTLHQARDLGAEVVRHVQRHDLVFYAAGLTFYLSANGVWPTSSSNAMMPAE